MASTMTAAHAPAVNHPSQRLAGFSVQHAAASESFSSDAVRHGSETVASVATSVAAAVAPLTGWTQGNVNPVTGKQVYVPDGAAGVPGSDPSYTVSNGVYTFNGNSGSGGVAAAGTSLAAAMANWLAANPTATTTTSTTPAAATPFDQLATLLTSLASQTPVTADTAADADTAATSVPTTTTAGGSVVIPLMLLLLAAGVGYWWWKTHGKHKKTGAA